MDMEVFYYIVLIVSVVSYLLGLFLSYFEKKGQTSVLSKMGNIGFVNIYGVNQEPPVSKEGEEEIHSPYIDTEII